jgi:hypothetical protein
MKDKHIARLTTDSLARRQRPQGVEEIVVGVPRRPGSICPHSCPASWRTRCGVVRTLLQVGSPEGSELHVGLRIGLGPEVGHGRLDVERPARLHLRRRQGLGHAEVIAGGLRRGGYDEQR